MTAHAPVTATEKRLLAIMERQGGTGSPESMYASAAVFAALAERGLVEALGTGRYRITPAGKRAAHDATWQENRR
jgi:hypothetical protein